MGPNLRIVIPEQEIADFCRRWNVQEFALFGSILTDAFGDESDVDVLVEFAPSARPTLFDLAQMEDELVQIFGRPVDLLTRHGVQQSQNYLRRQAILESAQVIYAA